MVGGEDEQNAHLLTDIPSSSSLESNGPFKRTGRDCLDSNCPCNNRGDGVWSGVTCMECSSARMDCRYPDPEFGPTRNRSYAEAVNSYLDLQSAIVCCS
ncbi:hypothetical protein F0562_011443 [Nyssa sinensis]|uniref:Uncharacterized protein n=1 Tax=Nyssa sinensis TaxID=561372 RepID=A0A5J5A3M1_9ASTE|nr:hypothetical protein F0562_011443 [Nyssa sinensis]